MRRIYKKVIPGQDAGHDLFTLLDHMRQASNTPWTLKRIKALHPMGDPATMAGSRSEPIRFAGWFQGQPYYTITASGRAFAEQYREIYTDQPDEGSG